VPDWVSLLRPELAEVSAYAPESPPGASVRLDANEASPEPTGRVRQVVARAIAEICLERLERYPDARMSRLRSEIARRTGARPDELLIGAGSDEVIAIVLTALAGRRGKTTPPVVLMPTPTFVMYRATARAHGHKAVEVPLDAAWDLDVRGMKRACEMMPPNVVFIASPNNPTGNRMGDDRVEAVLEAAADALVVVDEAYADYAGRSVRDWRKRYPNLAILRTLSKVGLAALRVGWLEADAGLVRELDKARQPYNVSATSQAAAAAVLSEAWAEVEAQVQRVVSERERVAAALRRIAGVDVPRSDANFLWVGTPRPAAEVNEALLARGVLVRSFHAAGGRMQNRLRVTLGTVEENDTFLDALAGALRA
jgi:histidinol-phosphate aminotransferase